MPGGADEDERATTLEVEEPVPVPPAPGSAWLAAYALGLAYSQRPYAERRHELVTAAGGCVESLRLGHARLLDSSVAEPDLQSAALLLLHEAMRSVTVDAAATPVVVQAG